MLKQEEIMRAGVMHYGLWLVVLLGFPVQAASINLTAEYKPATYEVDGAKFINTTPCHSESWSGFWCSGTSTVDQSQPVFISMRIQRVVKNNNKMFTITIFCKSPLDDSAAC